MTIIKEMLSTKPSVASAKTKGSMMDAVMNLIVYAPSCREAWRRQMVSLSSTICYRRLPTIDGFLLYESMIRYYLGFVSWHGMDDDGLGLMVIYGDV